MMRWLPSTPGLFLAVAVSAIPPLSAQEPRVALTGSHFIAVSVPDLEASAQWYREVFGLSVVLEAQADSNISVRVLGSEAFTVELISDRRAQPRPAAARQEIALVHGFIKAGVFVADLDAAILALRASGVAIEGQWLNSSPRNLIIRDPAGNIIQFFERKP